MIQATHRLAFRITATAVLMLTCAGCAFKVVHTPPLIVTDPQTGVVRVVNYPAQILVHDDQSLWDVHQIKNNIVGLFDGEFLHWVDVGLDAVIPGPDREPVENGIEWIKNEYAQLPDCAPVRIVGGFFSAFGIEKTTVLGAYRIARAPKEPISYFAVTRVVYLSDWVQDTVGEVNTGLGHLVPWEGSFVPSFMTAPINDAMDWMQFGAIEGYLWAFRELNIGADNALYGWEWCWGGTVSLFVDTAEPVDQAPAQDAPAKP